MREQVEPLDKQLGSAVRGLQDDLTGIEVPDFSPSSRRARAAVAVVALIVVGIGAYAFGNLDVGQVIETPPAGSVPEESKPSEQASLTWGQDAATPSLDWTRPALLDPYPDPVYGIPLRRITDVAALGVDHIPSSRRQTENADGTLVVTLGGDDAYRVYDRSSGDAVRSLAIHSGAEPQWHPTDPNKIRYMLGPNSYVGDLRLYEFDARSGEDAIIADLTGRIQTVVPEALYMSDKTGGSPSIDGNRYAWIVMNEEEQEIGIVSYDLAADQVLGIRTTLDAGYGAVRWVSATPSGDSVVAGFDSATVVWDADLGNERLLNQLDSPGDLAVQADGGDAWVYVDVDDENSEDAGWLLSVDLSTLGRTRLFQFYGGANTSVQVSGKGYDKPGWVIASTFNCSDAGAWTCDKVMAVEIGGANRILSLAHTYSCADSFWAEPQAVVNRSFTRVYFNSDGGSCGADAEIYELEVPDFE